MEKLNLSWSMYDHYIDMLVEKIDFKNYCGIYGVPRAGQLLANLISYRTNMPVMQSPWAESDICDTNGHATYKTHLPIHRTSNVLLIDDILDSGQTLDRWRITHDTACLFVKNKSPFCSTYWASFTDEWVVFPYERDNDTLSNVTIDNIKQRHSENND